MTWPLAGVLVTPPGQGRLFLEFDRVASAVVRSVSADELAALRIGRIALRRSRARGTHLANGCHACDVILGSHYVSESLTQFLAEGGHLSDLAVARWDIDVEELTG
jgi:hypothetical protein